MKKHIYFKLSVGFILIILGVILYSLDQQERRVVLDSIRYKNMLEQEGDDKAGNKKEAYDVHPKLIISDESDNETKPSNKSRKKSKPEDGAYDGVIDCLLEIPKIDMCRIVVTKGDIEYNLSNHYFTAARKNMQYGRSSYVIYGHQSFTRGKGMNRVDELMKGDCIYISGEGFCHTYVITEILESKAGELVEDFSMDANHLAIYTCKKQRERPKPYYVIRAVKKS